ncbi:sensor histidine kinase [Agromyces seonyuensis]|uniref:histidine kinase n=1 Tax=Agromyces seonyuensis TaxID=2662446 RepID=A0A6I4P3D8_9MICO|nr:HAMP domain-containing sensor histidine kinase [Agromyces seonyuensis]MWB97734.1 HAMP domain-containing protein [Agromyces seonyuensis]
MHQTLSERWNRISLRTKITGVTVVMLAFGVLVSGFGTAGMLGSFAEQQLAVKLRTIANGDLSQYFPSGIDTGDRNTTGSGDATADDDVFVAIYAPDGDFLQHNWADRAHELQPGFPHSVTIQQVYANDLRVFELEDAKGDSSYRAVAAYISVDGVLYPAVVAISASENQSLLTAFLTIYLGFGIGVVIVGGLLTRMLVTSTFAPLREVERTAAAIAEGGDFSQRLGGATPNTEVGRLNRSLNTMLNRIDRAFRDRARTIDQMRRFVGDASHELRTPLVSVRGYAELYRMGALQTPEDVAQAMDRIEKEAIRMGLLVEDLLALARLDEAKPLELTRVDLVPLARDAALDVRAAAPDRVVTLIAPDASTEDGSAPAPALAPDAAPVDGTDTGASRASIRSIAARTGSLLRRRPRTESQPVVESAPETAPEPQPATASVPVHHGAEILAEENKVRQVIANILGNALRYSPDGSPLELRVAIDEDAARAVLDVVDHGEGIPAQIREKIFQRFWRADTSRTRETGGTGLGLAIVASIVAAHNGTVEVVETPGGGATFRLSFPLADSPAAPQAAGA